LRQIKTVCWRARTGPRIHQLIRIEEVLGDQASYAGRGALKVEVDRHAGGEGQASSGGLA